jgi:UDP-N-acetylglucosamine diphosphorylase / glucose-1-phosphate thymidylyltransferase / UDP-N-acetylgalactosamine diphosphorylase / glucosamine-1-phosphate N-acetyltransferase / galactosamine-1-phosphate N-acetyltransferase
MITLLIPMAGAGSRFSQAGYLRPKPLIDVAGVPMFLRVMTNMGYVDETVLIVQSKHHDEIVREVANWKDKYPKHNAWGKVSTVCLDELTEGAACTVLRGIEDCVQWDSELIVANADQWLDWSPDHFYAYLRRRGADGGIPTFTASDSKWSFVNVKQPEGEVCAVAEKIPISDRATCGVYYYRTAAICRDAIGSMIKKNLRVNGEFYLAPTYNEMIVEGKKTLEYPVPRMYGMGTPSDLDETINSGVFNVD